jgi:D-lactate dehydrogenase
VEQIIDATVQNVTDHLAGRRSDNVLVPALPVR